VPKDHKYLDFVESLYSAADGKVPWRVPLATLVKLADGESLKMELREVDTSQLIFSEAVGDFSLRDSFAGSTEPKYSYESQFDLDDGRLHCEVVIHPMQHAVRPYVSDKEMLPLLLTHLKRAVRMFWVHEVEAIDPGFFEHKLACRGLTGSERKLAHALKSGESLIEFSRRNCRSMNTVYTHYRHIKSKLGCRSAGELHCLLFMISRPEFVAEQNAGVSMPPLHPDAGAISC